MSDPLRIIQVEPLYTIQVEPRYDDGPSGGRWYLSVRVLKDGHYQSDLSFSVWQKETSWFGHRKVEELDSLVRRTDKRIKRLKSGLKDIELDRRVLTQMGRRLES